MTLLKIQDRTEPYYYTCRDKDYFVLNECLIPKPIIDKVKELLFYGIYLKILPSYFLKDITFLKRKEMKMTEIRFILTERQWESIIVAFL
jgi:hypothetical protein